MKRDQEIIEATIELIMHKSPDKITMRDIASEAGLSLGLSYKYFKNKAAIFEQILQWAEKEVITSLDPSILSDPKKYIDFIIDSLIINKREWTVIYKISLNPGLITNSFANISKIEKLLETKIGKGKSQALFSTIVGFSVLFLFIPGYSEYFDREQFKNQILKLL